MKQSLRTEILQAELPSGRKFGTQLAAILSAICAYGLFAGWGHLLLGATFAAALLLLLFAWQWPALLMPLNRAWLGLGLLMGRIMNPVVMGVIFFFLITPVALLVRIFGRDELRLRRRNVESYWVSRQPPGPDMESFKRQY